MSDLPPAWASVADIGKLGLDTAAAVVERLLTLTRLTITKQPGGLTIPLLPATGDGMDARRVRAEAERLIDLYAEWTRSLVQAAVDAADPDRPPGEKLSLGPAPPDSSTQAIIWLHVLDGPAAGTTHLRRHRSGRSPWRGHPRGGLPLRTCRPWTRPVLGPARRSRSSSTCRPASPPVRTTVIFSLPGFQRFASR